MRTNGYTKCIKCLRTVRVADGKLCYHVRTTWGSTCEGFKTDSLWVEKHALTARGRNTLGECMACGETETNPDCQQCCYEKRHSE